MNYRQILKIITWFLLGLAVCMCAVFAFAVALRNSPGEHHSNFFRSTLITLCSGASCYAISYFVNKRKKTKLEQSYNSSRDGFLAVACCWFLAVVYSAIPFFIDGGFSICDSIFESASGLTTTGASVINSNLVLRNGNLLTGGIESLSHPLLLWRCMLNWLGGIGIIVFMLLLMPIMHLNFGKQLYNAEVPGIKTDGEQLTPRLGTSVYWLLAVYFALTILCALVFYVSGMDLFDAVCHAFATVSTGGFSTKNDSIGAYTHGGIHWVIIIFMFLSSCNFSIIIKSCRTRRPFYYFLRDEEWRFYFLMVIIVSVCATIIVMIRRPEGVLLLDGETKIKGLLPTLRTCFFQVVSLSSTTGLLTSDYESWGIPSVMLLLGLVMFPCGCGGSTAGGIKCSRIIVIIKYLFYEIRHCIFPHAVSDVRLNNERLNREVISKTFVFVMMFFVIFLLGTAFISLVENCDLRTAFGGALTCISNIGPGFGKVGPSGYFGWMHNITKLFLALVMVTGRLEIFTILILPFPSFWKR